MPDEPRSAAVPASPQPETTTPATKPAQAEGTVTAGGDVIFGNQTVTQIAGGDIVGRDKITGYTAEQVGLLIADIRRTFQPRPFDGRSPYKGLAPFDEDDAAYFFGRQRQVDELLGRLQTSRAVVIAGPSGSGKSSLVRAGLIAQLKQGALAGSEGWVYGAFSPRREPLEQLALAMARMARSPALGDYLRAQAAADPSALHKTVEAALTDRTDQRAILFVDQFEEIFSTLIRDDERAIFLDLLSQAATVTGGRAVLLVTLRSDFVARFAAFPRLNDLLNQQFYQVGAMQPEALVQAIALPALQVGLRIDPDLIAQVVNDMGAEPGALPLMQFALKDLFDAQQAAGGVIALTRADYLARGGLQKALERHADAEFSKLSASEQQLAHTVFRGLVQVGPGVQDTRRTALFAELVPAGSDPARVEAVIRQLADARLVITDEDEAAGSPRAGGGTVTLAHEKLLDAWPWLRRLVNENRAAIELQNEIAEDAQAWDQARRDPSYLYTGTRLATVREHLAEQDLALGTLAAAFVQAGWEVQQAARRARERQRNLLLVSVLVIGAVMTLLGLYGLNRSQEASRQAATAQAANTASAISLQDAQTQEAAAQFNAAEAQRQTHIARARELAAQSQAALDDFPQRSLLLAIEAVEETRRLDEQRVPAAETALRQALRQVGGVPFTGHEGRVTTLALSPDGQWLATGSYDGTVRLWPVAEPTAEPILLRGHAEVVLALAFSPDGQWLATGSWDHTARLWPAAEPTAEPIVLPHASAVRTLAFSPDGHWLATGDNDGAARVWNTSNLGAEPVVLPEHSWVETLAFSPDGHWLATGSYDGAARLWRTTELSAEPIVLSGHAPALRTLAFSPDGQWLATAASDSTARVWRVAEPAAEPLLLQHASGVQALAFSPDGRWLATGGWDHTVYLWPLANPILEPLLLQHAREVRVLAFSPDGQWLATGSVDGTAHLWLMADLGAEPVGLHGHEGVIQVLAFSPDGQRLVSLSQDGTPRLWSVAGPGVEPVVLPAEVAVETLAFSPDGQWLAALSDQDGTARLWHTADRFAEPAMLAAGGWARALAFSPDGQWLATSHEDDGARLWHLADPTAEPIALPGGGAAAAFSPDGHWLAALSSQDGTASLWRLADLTAEPAVLPGQDWVETLAFSPDGQWLATGSLSEDGTTRLWRLADPTAEPVVLQGGGAAAAFSPDGRWLATLNSQADIARLWPVTDPTAEPIVLQAGGWQMIVVSFSPDGQWLAAGSLDNTVRLWRMAEPTAEPVVLHGHAGAIWALAFSPDGQWLATGSEDGTVRLWRMAEPAAEPVVLQAGGRVRTLAFSPDGHVLATGGDDAFVLLWSMQSEALTQVACHAAGRNFSRAEWERYFAGQTYRRACELWPDAVSLAANDRPSH